MIKFGTAGWSYEDWYGIVYPNKKKSGFDPLEFLIKYLDTIEINSTFYFPPSPETTRTWAKKAKAKDDFLFSVKLWDRFTHRRDTDSGEDIRIFRTSIDPLKEENKLGTLLIQFPWSFQFSIENTDYILWLAAQFKDYNPCIELRSSGWENERFLNELKKNQIGFVNIDQPPASDSLLKTEHVTNETGYLRLHGRNKKNWFKKNALAHERYDYTYNREELSELSHLINAISDKAKTTYVIANNHFMGSAFKNSLELKSMVSKEMIKLPRSALKKFPDLARIPSEIEDIHFEEQGMLFDES